MNKKIKKKNRLQKGAKQSGALFYNRLGIEITA